MQPEKPMGNIIKNRFIVAKDNLEQKIKKRCDVTWV